ncbi:hypothetical protein M011DRAFT_481889 [Sporormia fimetaria CBS 119925]|uniref:Uncharacterized protein n=1 Tax=Sporormia fimetaria CBS 119925 TaxID=1340428 RepID=A0A6A6UXE2_9PLEO|nr:hypothetical protein M011DRAFT_481889 [Sporormia fimetaria CBS 119925]
MAQSPSVAYPTSSYTDSMPESQSQGQGRRRCGSMSDYARFMHEHTQRQMETATKSARRRSESSGSSSPSSLNGSVRSTDS